jgi:ethanolamine utilization protein EutA
LSVGIDIGTTTTQIVFSKIILKNTASSFLVPKVEIVNKNIVYRSKIYFTPLISRNVINLEKLKQIISEEYNRAGIGKDQVSTGAIIITGETARKENAKRVLNVLSDFAGDFVVATAGADLESILAGFGSGARELSKNTCEKVINFDIGGGTTNAAAFLDGEVIDTFALNIGGRLIQFDNSGNVTYISEKIKNIIQKLNLNITVGYKPYIDDLYKLSEEFAQIILKIANNEHLSKIEEELFIQHKNKQLRSKIFTFSGGVAEFVYSNSKFNSMEDILKYKDIGPILGECIKNIFEKGNYKLVKAKEKIRATVIGAGNHSIKLSGSTVNFDKDILPIKNIPIIKIKDSMFKNVKNIYEYVSKRIKVYDNSIAALAFKGPKSPKYSDIDEMAKLIVECSQSLKNSPIIIIAENDFAKALGQSIKIKTKFNRKVICLDGISTENGDYIDIGKPVLDVVPVVVKTLIFNN